MVQLVYSPQWFYGKDIIIDIFSFITLFLIAFLGFKYFRITKNKKQLLLSSSFFIMGLSFIAKIVTNFTIYYEVLQTKKVGIAVVTYEIVRSSALLSNMGFLSHRLLALFGLFLLYIIHLKRVEIKDTCIVAFFIIVTTYFSHLQYTVFYLTTLMFLIMITLQYYETYSENKNYKTALLVVIFSILALSQILFILILSSTIFYVIAELLQLFGYILLLVTFIMVLKHGKKKKQT